MPPKIVKQQPTISELLSEAARSISQSVREPNIAMYKPHEKQKVFHMLDMWGRLYIGGNRSGKSYGCVVEDIWWCTDTHPFINTPKPPIRGRVVAVDFNHGVDEILLPLFKRLMVPSMLIDGSWDKSFSKQDRTLTFANKSTIEFMSYEQEIEKFAGTSRHFIHYDEEPPKGIFDECQMRIIDTEGNFWISMTPVTGISWVYEVLYKSVISDPDANVLARAAENFGQVVVSNKKELAIVEVDMDENPYLTAKGKNRAMGLLDNSEDISARKAGKFVELSGLVFKKWSPETHVIPAFVPPLDWEWFTSIDHGWNNPTAILWHAVAPNGTVYTFSEHYKSEMTIEQHATVMHLREAAFGKEPEFRTGDPAMKQTSGITATSVLEEYAKYGIYMSVETVPRDVSVGIARMQQYFRINPATGNPKWFVTENCINFISELKGLRWKKYASKKSEFENNKREEIHKKNDHACDSARYFATFLPELAMDEYIDPDMPAPLPKPIDMTYAGLILRALNSSDGLDRSDNEWSIVEGIDYADR